MKFLKIRTEYLVENLKFEFHLYLYDKERKKRFVALYAQAEITADNIDDWFKIENAGGYLQIEVKDIDNFYRENWSDYRTHHILRSKKILSNFCR